MNHTRLLPILLVVALTTTAAQQHHPVYINEFLASNVYTNPEIADFNDFSDWLELYNAGNSDVDMGGYFITDKKAIPCKWQLPPGTVIKAHGALLIWADGYNEVPGKSLQRTYYPYDPFVTRNYHANFKLDKAGEFLALVAPDSVIIDSVSYGPQTRDISRGRFPDGAPHWVWFGEPTPGTVNTTPALDTVEFASPPTMSLPGGFYTGTQTVSLNTTTPGAEIRYTLDGSRPTGASPLYTGALTVSTPTVLTARTFAPGKVPSIQSASTYFVGVGSTLPVISLSTPPAYLWDPAIGIYAHNLKSREIPIHFEFFKEDQSPAIALDASLSLTGQASLLYPQKSFTIGADDRFGTDMISYQVFPERKLDQFKSLYLRNAGVPDNRSTFFRDALLHSLLLNKVDVDCQAYRPTAVFLNAAYWGIYNIRDKIDRFYISALHNLNPDDVDLLEYEADINPTVMEGNADNYQEFSQYVAQNDLSQEAQYRFIETWMDVDEYINYMISGIYDDNVYWMEENVRMWRERKPGARWRWILHDTDFGFGMPNPRSIGYANNTLRFATSSNFSDPYVPPQWSTLLFRKLLQNQQFRTKFIQRFASHLNSTFHPDTVVGFIDRFQTRLASEMPRHINRWKDGEPYFGNPIPDVATWQSNVNVLRTFARNRPRYQRQHLIDYFQLGGVSGITIRIASQGTGRVRINGVENVTTNSTRTYFKGVPTTIEAVPEVGYRFVRWEGIAQTTDNPTSITTTADSLTVTAFFESVTVHSIPSHIERDTTLTRGSSPYYALSDVVVDSGATLRLTEGVRVLMPEGSSIMVHGRLLVEGTEADPVILEPNEQSPHWGALCFVNTTDSSIMSHLIIRSATKGPDFSRDRAAISGFNARICLRYVSVEKVQMPLFARYGSVVIQHCRFHTTYAGDLINIKSATFAATEDCELQGDEGYDSDGIDYDDVHGGFIRNNRIFGISGFNSDAIDLGEGAVDILVEGNTITNINDKGVSVGQASTTLVRRNVIANCGMGVAVKDFNSHAQVEQNTFYANHVAVACYEKNLGHGGGQADVVNSILANSTESSTLVDPLSRLTISYSISNTDSLAGLHNARTDPVFLNDLYLAPGSPAIDFGSPLLPNDPDGSLPDAGAFPFQSARSTAIIIDEIHYHPIEGSGNEFIELYNASPAPVNLSGYRVAGDVQYQFGNVTVAHGEYIVLARNVGLYAGKGYQVFQWTGGGLPDSGGTLRITNSEGREVDRVDYGTGSFWPAEPNGLGPSLELRQMNLENMVSTSWSISYAQGGTPGASRNSGLLTGLFINEFMADNDAVLADEHGEFDDWIEIYNANSVPVDIGGLYVTDNLKLPGKFMIPTNDTRATTIPAKGFLIFWADGQTDQGVRHLSIKLDRAGEQIGLARSVDAGYVYIDSLTFTAQALNKSYGRVENGSPTWTTFATPTPGASNGTTGTDAGKATPTAYALEQNYPNPFNPSSDIRYQISEFRIVRIAVYDILGREVAVLVNEKKDPGTYTVTWNAAGIASGMYLCRMTAGPFTQTRKMLVVR